MPVAMVHRFRPSGADRSRVMRDTIKDVCTRVEGDSFSEALQKHQTFNKLFVRMVSAANAAVCWRPFSPARDLPGKARPAPQEGEVGDDVRRRNDYRHRHHHFLLVKVVRSSVTFTQGFGPKLPGPTDAHQHQQPRPRLSPLPSGRGYRGRLRLASVSEEQTGRSFGTASASICPFSARSRIRFVSRVSLALSHRSTAPACRSSRSCKSSPIPSAM